MAGLLRVVFISMVVFAASSLHAQTGNEPYAVNFFLNEPPAISPSVLPPAAQNVIVAKVRVRTVYYRGGRHPGDDPQPLPSTILGAQVDIIEALRGTATPGAEAVVNFGQRGSTQKFKYPHTPSMRTRDYFIMFYREADGGFRLLGFPIGQEEYEKWDSELWAYERERGKPGHQDK